MTPKVLIFGIWIKVNKSLPALKTALEQIASNASSIYQANGKILISASVAGQSFSYALPDGINVDSVLSATFDAWKIVNQFTSNSELETWLNLDTPRNMLIAF